MRTRRFPGPVATLAPLALLLALLLVLVPAAPAGAGVGGLDTLLQDEKIDAAGPGPLDTDAIDRVAPPRDVRDDAAAPDPPVQSEPPAEPAVSLNVPLRNQLARENGKDGPDACGPTSLGMAMQFLGRNVSTPNLIRQCKAAGDWPPNFRILARVAARNGFPGARAVLGGDLNWLRRQIAARKPVLLRLETDGGHFVVARGYDAAGNILCNDPWDGVRRVIPPSEMRGVWQAALTLR